MISRILLLLVFVVWMTGWSADQAAGGGRGLPSDANAWVGALPFVAFYALLVFVLVLYSRLLARRVAADNLHRSLRRFSWMVHAARFLIPAWLAVGVFVPQMGWVPAVRWALDHTIGAIPGNEGAIRSRVLVMLYLPSVLLGTLPALLAWVGLIWAQYPADRALREQNMLVHLENDLPLHAAPRFWNYFTANLRLQVLFIVVPVLLIMLCHDGLLLAGVQLFKNWLPRKAFLTKADSDLLSRRLQLIETGAQAVSFVLVFLFSPEVLRRVLQTEPLPAGTLRKRLEAMCERTGMRCRQILLWRTQETMGNAAVMGFVPQVRYVLLSDLLLESMTDEQVEAVFAHEIGHVVHRHMAWYAVFIIAMAMLFAGPGQALAGQLEAWRVPERMVEVLGMLGFGGAMFAGFMFLSQRCERQADVYAARTMEAARTTGHMGGTNGANGHGTATSINRPAYAITSAGASGSAVVTAPPPATYGAGEVVVIAPLPSEVTAPAVAGATNGKSYVGQYGASVFASALHRVAVVNNIPVKSWSWCHGSISTRMDYVRGLSRDPALTGRFDRFMRWVFASLVLLLLAGVYAAWQMGM